MDCSKLTEKTAGIGVKVTCQTLNSPDGELRMECWKSFAKRYRKLGIVDLMIRVSGITSKPLLPVPTHTFSFHTLSFKERSQVNRCKGEDSLSITKHKSISVGIELAYKARKAWNNRQKRLRSFFCHKAQETCPAKNRTLHKDSQM